VGDCQKCRQETDQINVDKKMLPCTTANEEPMPKKKLRPKRALTVREGPDNFSLVYTNLNKKIKFGGGFFFGRRSVVGPTGDRGPPGWIYGHFCCI
jgi:hypothetical protein